MPRLGHAFAESLRLARSSHDIGPEGGNKGIRHERLQLLGRATGKSLEHRSIQNWPLFKRDCRAGTIEQHRLNEWPLRSAGRHTQ
jgi:hypothetical protein